MEKLRKAKYEAEVKIGKWAFPACVLTDKTRVLSLSSIYEILDAPFPDKLLRSLLKFASHPSLRETQYASSISSITEPLHFLSKSGLDQPGIEANELISVCRLLLKAREYQLLESRAEVRSAQASESFLVSIATVGLIAIIDEATGFQDVRDKQALQSFLDLYLKREHAVWAKRFPDDFYIQMFRLQGWTWQGMSVNRPSIVGTYTRDIVYARIAPCVLKELETRNPRLEGGERQWKHHQFLTDDIGHPALSQHLYAVIALMKASRSWTGFNSLLKEAFPRKGDQLDLLDLRDSDLD